MADTGWPHSALDAVAAGAGNRNIPANFAHAGSIAAGPSYKNKNNNKKRCWDNLNAAIDTVWFIFGGKWA